MGTEVGVAVAVSKAVGSNGAEVELGEALGELHMGKRPCCPLMAR